MHSALIMYAYIIRLQKSTSSRGESARLCAVSLSAVSAMPRYTGGRLKRKKADLNARQA